MDWLKERREALGLTQDELTARLQVEGIAITRGTLSNWETGRHPLPLQNEDLRLALSKVLKLSTKEILRLSGFEVISYHSDAGEKAAHLVDNLKPEQQELALRILEQFAG